jgi:YVTN family beta-propeller protein
MIPTMRGLVPLLVGVLLALWACEPRTQAPADVPDSGALDKNPSAEQCEPGEPDEAALEKSGYYEIADGDEVNRFSIITTGQAVTPAGDVIGLQRFPWGLAISPDGERAYTLAGSGLSLEVIDLSVSPPVVLERKGGLSNDHGPVLNADGSLLYVPGAGSQKVFVFAVNRAVKAGESELSEQAPISVTGHVGALALSPDEQILYVLIPTSGEFVKIPLSDPSTQTRIHVGHTPYDVALSADGAKAYVSNWGGAEVAIVDTAALTIVGTVDVGKNPEGLALVEGGTSLMVTNSDEDSISIIDTATMQVSQTLDLDPENPELKAWSPNAIAVHPNPEAHRAYVASADHNAIEVIDTQTFDLLGSIPTGWYPVRVGLTPDGEKLVVVNAKGWGYLNPGDRTNAEMYGTLQVAPVPANALELEVLTRQVEANNTRPSRFFPDSNCEAQVPLPLTEDETSVIEHVILIVKENKTYDEILGDLVGPEGDEWHSPEYARNFGMGVDLLDGSGEKGDVTPNHHALASTFIDFVNFYADAEVSLQGHMWTTQADCNDWVEKTHWNRVPATGVDPNTVQYNKSYFDHFDKNNISFRVYGEAVNFAITELEKWRDRIDLKYPFWSNGVTDVDKAARIIHEWNLSVETGEKSLFPQFIYIVLPNDHTYGSAAGAPHPQSMVADNDAAVGMLVDWLSHSPYWEKSLMFVIQDDPQSSVGDHIDAHRSMCFAISPWVKRGQISTVHYSVPSMYRTIELILGAPPINKNTLIAPPMIDIFTDTPNLTPYTAIPRQIGRFYNPESGKFAEEAKKYDWAGFDGHDGLGDLLWRYMNGDALRPVGAKRIDD